MPKYDSAIIFTKRGNLHDYLYTDRVLYDRYQGREISSRHKEYFEQEREIQLILLTRVIPANGPYPARYFCKIKCPVNPLPVKEEFEVPSFKAIVRFLNDNGWSKKQSFSSRMFE